MTERQTDGHTSFDSMVRAMQHRAVINGLVVALSSEFALRHCFINRT